MDCVTQLGLVYAYQGQVREAHAIYEKGIQVAEQAGGGDTVYAGKLCFELADLEYLRHHWVESRIFLQKARACFRACTGQSDSQLEALVVMRLGDLHRRQGLLRRAVSLYESAIKLASKTVDVTDDSEPVLLLQNKDATPREAKILGIFAKRANMKGKDVMLDTMEIWRQGDSDDDEASSDEGGDDDSNIGNSLVARITGKIARCELLRENYTKATKLITTVLKKYKTTHVTKCTLMYHKGVIGLRTDDYEAARKTLTEAYELCRVWNIPALTRRVCQALALSLLPKAPLESTVALSMSLGIVAKHRMCNLIAEYKRPKKKQQTVEDGGGDVADVINSNGILSDMANLSLNSKRRFERYVCLIACSS